MARLTAEERNNLPDQDFAIPERREYPIHNRAHAIDALSRVSADGSDDDKRRVAIAVNKRYPTMRTKLREMAT